MILKLTNNMTKVTKDFFVTDLKDSNMFYHFDLNLEEGMSDGEYTYELLEGEDKLAKGLLQIGDYKKSEKQYNKKKTYKVYGK
jgi:hypothetical protein